MQKMMNKQQDISIAVAIFLLIIVSAAYLLVGPLRSLNFEAVEYLFESNRLNIYFHSVIIFINLSWYGSIISRRLGYKKQGSRLNKLTPSKKVSANNIKWILISLIGSIIIFLIAFYSKRTNINWPISLLQFDAIEYYIKISLCLNFAAIAPILIPICNRTVKGIARFTGRDQIIPERPQTKNRIYLGTEAKKDSEDRLSETSNWVGMNEAALNAGILVTGSVGSGKTIAALMPIIAQMIDNFEIFPSILALDPKNNFNQDLIRLLKDKEEDKRIYHLRINGNVTINPFYKEFPLRDANFIEISRTFRYAADNFMGDKNGSVFWDESAFNLLKNAVVFCGAIYGYTTIEHIYLTLIEAVDISDTNKMISVLRKKIDSESFNEEELFNINCSIRYFSKEFINMDSKLKTGVLATATVFLNMFQEYHANKLFCPSKEKLTITSFDDFINDGKVLIFDIQKEGLAAPMATYVKLLYQQAVLNRTKYSNEQNKKNLPNAVLIADEYPDVVTAISRGISDVSVLAKGRSSKLVFIAASQSLSSISAVIKNKELSDTLFQNFRTRIHLHSNDLKTIRLCQELIWKEDKKKVSHSISEMSQKAKRNFIHGGFDSENANISESINTSTQQEYIITAKDFMSLRTFEAIAIVYDGVSSKLKRIFLKPSFVKKANTPHRKIIDGLLAASLALTFFVSFGPSAKAFPHICTVVNSAEFSSCLAIRKSSCMCKSPWPLPPHPCARLTYYVPQSFIEVQREARSSYFKSLPAAATQLASLPMDDLGLPNGTDADNSTYTYHAHTLAIPFGSFFHLLPCGGARFGKTCFDGMSEHLGMNWKTGKPDLYQPKFLAWSVSPKMCLMKGAATSAVGGGEFVFGNEGGCSFPMSWLKYYPPSNHSVCNGWGTHFPRSGTYMGMSQVAGALSIAGRIKSLSSEVFRSMPSSYDEKWQMIYPQSSSCFREGQNLGILELPKRVNEVTRMWNRKKNGFLFATWKKVSCCVEYFHVPAIYASLSILKSICRGFRP